MFALLERLAPVAMVSAGNSSVEPLITTSAKPATDPTTEPSASKPTTEIPTAKPMSAEQQNATRSAKSYLATGAFSRKGLIEQLSSDTGSGYSVEAATQAVDSLDIDFNEQAAKSAKNYLRFSAFSRKGLIEQLSSDSGGGFTHSEAVYGASEAGL
jgi:hypothetical protein